MATLDPARATIAFVLSLVFTAAPDVQARPEARRWVASWAASAHGPYPAGNELAQPNLKTVFPSATNGAQDQSFRLIVQPQIWSCRTRLRLSNAFGNRPVTFTDVYIGLQLAGSALVPKTNRPVTWAKKQTFKVDPGETVWSDAVMLPFACGRTAPALAGRKLAVSFHVQGQSGPMTWHAKALQTSYVSRPAAGAGGLAATADEGEAGFPFSTTSWYFLDAVDMWMPPDARAVVALGDSITDGTNATLNGDDRWPDVLGRRLRATFGDRVAVINAGIGGNQVCGPPAYSTENPASGGPSALDRLDRDLLSLSGVTTVIWFQGINDLSLGVGTSAQAVADAMTKGVTRMRARIPGVRIFAATVTTTLGAAEIGYGEQETDAKRQALNAFIRKSEIFDAVLDFDRTVRDPGTGRLRPEFAHDTTIGGPADGIHPNRLGYQAMGMSVDVSLFRPAPLSTTAHGAGGKRRGKPPRPDGN